MESKFTPSAYSIFVNALEFGTNSSESRVELEEYLETQCGNDRDLRSEVEELLLAHQQAGEFIEQPLFVLGDTTTRTEPAPTDCSELKLVDYKLIRQIGSGGFGDVFLARQSQPLERDVAIKVLKPGIDSNSVVARFRAEQQTLALMDHPNIATVLDASTTDDERPYFVMEFINGVPITDYCNGLRLSIDDRLRLFMDVCSAVEHAHQKSVVHRDLKPSNILVTTQNGSPCVKVIDFGIAKAIDSGGPSSYVQTAPGMLIGTPQYMSPEQASMGARLVDTRTDVYSLAAVLYELLTGTPPLNPEASAADLEEVVALIQDGKVQRPSDRMLSATGGTAAERNSTLHSLARLLSTELDWVLIKALETVPDDRYSTVSGFREDIERFLNDIPVQAAPPSAWYHARKFVRRHRALTFYSAIVLLVAALGFAGTIYGLIQATESAKRAEKAKEESVALAERKKKVVEAFVSSFRSADPENNGVAHDTPAKEILFRARERIDEELDGDPLTKAELLEALGLSFLGLGEYDSAQSSFQGARNIRRVEKTASQEDMISDMHNVAGGFLASGDLDRAVPLYEETVALSKYWLGEGHRDTLASMANLAVAHKDAGDLERALQLNEETLGLRRDRLGSHHLDTLNSMHNLADCCLATGDLERATRLSEESLKFRKIKLGNNHPDTLNSMHILARCYLMAGDLKRAVTLNEETLKARKVRLGLDHHRTIASMASLAAVCLKAGATTRATTLLEESLDLGRVKLGFDHPVTLSIMNNLAMSYADADDARALPLLKETLKLRQKKLGADHPKTLTSMNNLGTRYRAIGDLELAVPILEETLELSAKKLGPNHPDTLDSMNNLGMTYQIAGDLELANPLLKDTLERLKKVHGPDHPLTLVVTKNLALGYQDSGDIERAILLLRNTVKLRKNKLDHPDTLTILQILADAYMDFGDLRSAASTYEKILRSARNNSDEPMQLKTLQLLQQTELHSGLYSEAESTIRTWINELEKKQTNATTLALAYTSLAAALSGQGDRKGAIAAAKVALRNSEIAPAQKSRAIGIVSFQLAKAGKISASNRLIHEFANLVELLPSIDRRQRWYAVRMCERIIEVFDEKNQSEEAAKWRSRRESVSIRISELGKSEIPREN